MAPRQQYGVCVMHDKVKLYYKINKNKNFVVIKPTVLLKPKLNIIEAFQYNQTQTYINIIFHYYGEVTSPHHQHSSVMQTIGMSHSQSSVYTGFRLVDRIIFSLCLFSFISSRYDLFPLLQAVHYEKFNWMEETYTFAFYISAPAVLTKYKE